jgi:hypothetical protein
MCLQKIIFLIMSDKSDTLSPGLDHATLGISIMFTMTKRLKRSTLVPVTAFAAALMLAACGSGGGSSSSPTTPTDPTTPVNPTDPTVKTSVEGYWGGPTNRVDPATGASFVMAGPVLENGEYWLVVSLNGLIDSMVHGKGQSASNKFNSTDAKFWGKDGVQTNVAGTLASTDAYVVNTSFPGIVNWLSGTQQVGWSFSLRYDSSYDTPASTAYVVGNWAGTVESTTGRERFTFVVTSQGAAAPALTMTILAPSPQAGCVWSGTIAPRASGKNIYNVAMTIGQQSSCALPGTVFSGIATPGINASTGKPRLVLTVIDSSNTYDFIGLIDVAP